MFISLPHRFLDDRIFATCSDDCSVCIWDLRNLKSRVHQLSGHKSWVKNIEYSRRDRLIVTSGLDGSIYTWDVNRGDESRYQKVFHTPGLMRCRISSDETKMVICTTGGYLIIVNDLNLTTLAADLKGFRPNIHRLMQLGDQYFPIVSEFKHVFDSRRRRNRIELISDFPEGNEAEVICSLAIHPHNWVAVSRNMNADEQSEWTCVHDIQEMADPYQHQQKKRHGSGGSQQQQQSAFVDQEEEYDAVKLRVANEFAELRQQVLDHVERKRQSTSERACTRAKVYLKKVNRFLTLLGCPGTSVGLPVVASTSNDIWSGQIRDNRLGNSSILPIRSGLISARVVQDLVHPERTSDNGIYLSSSDEEDVEEEEEEEEAEIDQEEDDSEEEDAAISNDVLLQMHVDGIPSSTQSGTQSSGSNNPHSDHFYAYVGNRLTRLIEELRAIQKHMNNKYKTNKPRLLYYTKESNAGKGFIKEICFSSDGRVMASPYGNGVRILSFDDKCHELSDCVESWSAPQKPKELSQVVVDKNSHSNLVVCTKFSPNYPLLVSGCLKGSIVWHYPKL